MQSGLARILAGVVSVLLTLAIGALGAVRDDQTTTLSVSTPSIVDVEEDEVTTTTAAPATTTTTEAPATTTTTAPPPVPTTKAQSAPLTPLSTTTVAPTTTVAARTIQVTPDASHGPRAYVVSGAGCTGSDTGVGVYQYDSTGQQIMGDGAAAMPDGTWSIPVNVPTGAPAGPITFKAYCFAQPHTKLFDYAPETVVVS